MCNIARGLLCPISKCITPVCGTQFLKTTKIGITVKPILSCHSKNDKTNALKTNDSLMKVKSIAEHFFGAFCNTFECHQAIIGLKNKFLVFFLSGRFRQVLYIVIY